MCRGTEISSTVTPDMWEIEFGGRPHTLLICQFVSDYKV